MPTPPAPTTKAAETPEQRRTILITVRIALMAVIASVTGLNVAQQQIAIDFNASQSDVLWMINLYAITLAGLLLPLGALGDRLGRRPMLLTGLIVFGLANAVAGLAPNTTVTARSRRRTRRQPGSPDTVVVTAIVPIDAITAAATAKPQDSLDTAERETAPRNGVPGTIGRPMTPARTATPIDGAARRGGQGTSGAGLVRLHAPGDGFFGGAQLVSGAEQHELGAGVSLGDVSGGHVKGLAFLDDLVAVVVVHDHAAAEQVAPVRTTAMSAGQAGKHRCQRMCLGDVDEARGVPVEVAEPVDRYRVLVHGRGCVLGDGRQGSSLMGNSWSKHQPIGCALLSGKRPIWVDRRT